MPSFIFTVFLNRSLQYSEEVPTWISVIALFTLEALLNESIF